MTDTSFEIMAISHFRNLVRFKLSDVEAMDDDAAVTCYERDPSCSGGCLDWRQICNGMVDCNDSRDEVSCHLLEFNECLHDEYRCRSGHCIPMKFAFDGTFDYADGSDEDKGFLESLALSQCYRRVPNIFCDDLNSAWMTFPCGDGESILSPFLGCANQRYYRTIKMLYTDNATLCWQHLVCTYYLDYLFPLLVNCTVLCGKNRDCSPLLSSVCHEKIVIFVSARLFGLRNK